MAEGLGAGEYAALLNRFYKAATDVLVPLNAMIDKMIGDEVMALFIPATGPEYRSNAVLAAVRLLEAVGYGSKDGPWLPVGIGLHAGTAYVGKVGGTGINDVTAIGDTVNSAARIQSEAKAGEVVLSDDLYASVSERYPDLEQRTVDLRGREQQMQVRVLRIAEPAS